jgi:translocation and assembly module TamB
LVRGRIDILAKRFNLDEGTAQFQGDFLPYLRFVTSSNTNAGTARVILEGPADDPEITFESTPAAPQDEVLAQLLFGADLSDISPFQAVQLANAVSVLAGGKGIGLVGNLRKGFGLDDLDITTTDSGETAVRAGKYISEDIYTDITASANGESEISLNFDLTDSLKAKGTVEANGDTGLGIFFERDY